MEVMQPPSAAAPAPGAQMAPERRAAVKGRFSAEARTYRWQPLWGSGLVRGRK